MTNWLHRFIRQFRAFREDSDIREELQAHYDALIDEGLAKGLPDREARRSARLSLGNPRSVLERVRDVELSSAIESWYGDFLFGLRSLRRSPVFSITAIMTLAVGIGANTVIFTLLYGLLLRSLPVEEPSQLARIGVATATMRDPSLASAAPYQMLPELRRLSSFSGISAWMGRAVPLGPDADSARLSTAALVSGDAFALLGMQPHLGRLLSPADDVRGGPAEGWPAVLSYACWTVDFGGDLSVLGKQIRLASGLVTVVGVAPEQFRGVWPGSETKVYLPIQFLTVITGKDEINLPDSPVWATTLARLKPGVSLSQARAEFTTYQTALMNQFLPAGSRERILAEKPYLAIASARSGLPTFFGTVYAAPLYLMQGLVAVVLLLCCINVAGLMMSKVYARQREFAVRTAIGAARWRLVRQYLTESFLIALGGAALGAAAAWYGTGLLLPFFRHPNEGMGMSIQPDATVFVATGFFAVLTTLLFGTLPAWRAGAADPAYLLKSRGAGGGRRQILGRSFIPLQVGLSFALVSIAVLLSQSLIRLETEQTGFDLDHVTIQTAPFHLLNLTEEARMELYHQMKDRLEQMPGIESASFTLFTPMTSFQATSSFQAASGAPDALEDSRMAYNHVGPGYFQTMRTTILEGREFKPAERDLSVCVLNQSAAAFLFPRQAAVGQYVRSTDTKRFPQPFTCRVIGVAQDAKFANLHEPPPRTIYFPVQLETLHRAGNLVFLLNAPTKVQAIAAYRKVRGELSPATPFVLFVTLREQMDAALGSQRALSLMSNFFAALALFLSGLGLYGLLSSGVTQRTAEIGVRMALGAQRGRILRMILCEALWLFGVGLAFGGVVLLTTVRFVQPLLYGVTPSDPLRFTAIAGVLAAVAILAGLAPALRAASIDPIQSLRAE